MDMNKAKEREYKKSEFLSLWEKYEDIAMHFNDLIIQLRIRALAGIGAIAAMVVIFSRVNGSEHINLLVIPCTSLVLLVVWTAIRRLDNDYYSKLLSGAVIAIENLERESKRQRAKIPAIEMSTIITRTLREYNQKKSGKFKLLLFLNLFGFGYDLVVKNNNLVKEENSQTRVDSSRPGRDSFYTIIHCFLSGFFFISLVYFVPEAREYPKDAESVKALEERVYQMKKKSFIEYVNLRYDCNSEFFDLIRLVPRSLNCEAANRVEYFQRRREQNRLSEFFDFTGLHNTKLNHCSGNLYSSYNCSVLSELFNKEFATKVRDYGSDLTRLKRDFNECYSKYQQVRGSENSIPAPSDIQCNLIVTAARKYSDASGFSKPML